MAAKTFAPQLLRMLRHVRRYVNKHSAKLQATVSGAEWTAIQTIVTQIAVFDAEHIDESP